MRVECWLEEDLFVTLFVRSVRTKEKGVLTVSIFVS